MSDVEDVRRELIAAEDGESDEFRAAVFVERACDILEEGDVVEGATLCQWQGVGARQRRLAVSAAAFHPQDGSVSLVLGYLDGAPGDSPSIGAAVVNKQLRMLSGFLEAALAGDLDDEVGTESPVGELVAALRARRQEGTLTKGRLLVVTDTRMSDRVRELAPEIIDGVPCDLQVWDVGRLAELQGKGHEALEIDLEGEFGTPIPCLSVDLPTSAYKSYLCVVPARLLAELYGRFGARLLETNVRGFLSDRGKVNRGLRATIQGRPHMFFAYNNGLTATATAVITGSAPMGGSALVGITGLQIVNGGQTTASLFWAKRKHNSSLDGVFVQMKLSVIPEDMSEQLDQIVSDISRYANSQNKVSDADLFANHPFHREIEKFSRRISGPARDGRQHQSYWFYERARAQYQNARAGLSKKECRDFDLKFPKSQLVLKTDLAKFMNAWDQLPHVVSAGAQKSFKRFAEQVTARWERNPDQFNEVFFKRAMAIGALWRSLERLVQAQAWYQGHRAAIVPYTLATLSHAIEVDGRKLNLLGVWKTPLSAAAEEGLAGVAGRVWRELSTHPDRKARSQWGNLGEWFKAEQCWVACKNLNIGLPDALDPYLISEEQYASQDTAGIRGQSIGAGIDAQTEVVKLNREGFWRRLKDWNQEEPVLAESELESICRLLAAPESRTPSEFDSRVLMQAKLRAETNGFL